MGYRVWFDWIQFLPTGSWYIYIGRKREFVGAGNKTPCHAYRGKASSSFAHNLFFSYPIILKFCTEYGSITVVLCAKLWKDWTTKTDVTDERDYEKVEFKMSFGRMSYIAQAQAGHWTWWRHQMETFSALLAICAVNSPVPGEFPHKGQWRGALMFSLIYARISGWVNTGEAGDFRCHHAHYDVIAVKVLHTEGMVSRGLLLRRGAMNCTYGLANTPFIYFYAQIPCIK